MQFNSVFDIIGPIMVGPSSSHTAGTAKIGKAVFNLLGRVPKKVNITFYGSFAKTYKGHGSDVAIIGGLLGLPPCDETLKDSIEIAEKQGILINFIKSNKQMEHPNTIDVLATDCYGKSISVRAQSLGGGIINIILVNDFNTKLSGENHAILVFHVDKYGVVAHVTGVLAKHKVNIAHMEVSRSGRGDDALMSIEIDQKIDEEILEELTTPKFVNKVVYM